MTQIWIEDEASMVEELFSLGNTYGEISEALALEGYTRSKEAVRNYIKRNREKFEEIKEENNMPKILIFDIETLPIKTYTWGIFKQVIPPGMVIEDWCVLSWSAKWLYDSEIYSDILTPREAVRRDDKRLIKGIWDLFEEADILVAHNGAGFDVKKLKARFFYHKMKPNTPYQVIDTLKQSRKNFGFTSHKLNFLSQIISNKEKIHTDFDLWRLCDNGDQGALNKMLEYNEYDTVLLEEVFLEMLPWMTSGPNMGIYLDSEEPICGHCGSENINWNGYYITPANKYRSFRCKDCGGIGRSRKSSIPKEVKDNLMLNTAR